MKIYKIRHKKTGKFSNGGKRPSWTETGKAYSKLNLIKQAIRWTKGYKSDFYENSEIVTFELNEISCEDVQVKAYKKMSNNYDVNDGFDLDEWLDEEEGLRDWWEYRLKHD